MNALLSVNHIRGCTQIFRFYSAPPESFRTDRLERKLNGTALCHWVQFYLNFVSQPSEFCRHNPLCCFSTSVYCCLVYCLFHYWLGSETFGYTLV